MSNIIHRRSMLSLVFLLLLSLSSITVSAQSERQVSYDISFPDAVHHEARISINLTGITNNPVIFWMSRSSPGRYALHEFAKNVYDISAVDNQGHALKITRPNPSTWAVHGTGGTVHFTYTLYGDRTDGTHVGIDQTQAHLNVPATFMWAVGFEDAPIRIHFQVPPGSGWKIATQLKPTSNPTIFTAPDRQYFMDSPTELSDFTTRTWQEKSGNKTYTMRLDLHFMGTENEATAFANMLKRIVIEEKGVFGELPSFDYGTYTFIADYLPWATQDGMEHRNSTILTSPYPLSTNMINDLSAAAHEFFHSWNMERLRSQSIEPFDFTRANMSKELWFGEGFTSYYDKLILRRAGYLNNTTWAHIMGEYLNTVINSPGRQFNSLVQMSQQAPFEDPATSFDAQNSSNTYISYYTWGSVVGMGLDLMLRSKYNLTLDDYMKTMWQKFGKSEQPYTMNDLEQTLGEITKDTAFAHHFFNAYILGKDLPDFKDLLSHAGFLLRNANPDHAVLQFGKDKLHFSNKTAIVTHNTIVGSPLYQAGIDRGDVITELDGHPVEDRDYMDALLNEHQPGDGIEVAYLSRGKRYHTTVTLASNPTLELVPYEDAGLKLSKSMREFRDHWFSNKK